MSLHAAHVIARWQTRQYRRLFDTYLGSNRSSYSRRGQMLVLYNRTRRELFSLYNNTSGAVQRNRIINALNAHQSIASSIALAAIVDTTAIGTDAGRQQHEEWLESTNQEILRIESIPPASMFTAAPLRLIHEQNEHAKSMVKSGLSPRMLIGDKNRVGYFSPWPINVELSKWMVIAGSAAVVGAVAGSPNSPIREESPYRRQAIAVIDERTTNCCLKVHGQIRDLDEPFKLTGTPRYADELDSPPFHRYCRTATALYLPGFDDGLTSKMRQSSKEQIARNKSAEKGSKYVHPASALSRFDWKS